MTHALRHGQFLSNSTGSELISDTEPFLMSALFPQLDPWGIGGFNAPERSKDQRISFERQLKNVLKQVDSPFVVDSTFSFVCWNIIQKRDAGESVTFSIKSSRRNERVCSKGSLC